MSEYVEASLEELTDVFYHLKYVKLFTEEEIRAIYSNCSQHEYKLQKRVKSPVDFRNYIEYLKNFAQLIYKRQKAYNIWEKKERVKNGVYNKIDDLYGRVCERFTSETELWLDRIDFCTLRQMQGTASRYFARLIQLHSDNEEIWVMAAEWEMKENGSSENCRRIFQDATQRLRKSELIWTRFFEMELKIADTVYQRQLLLVNSGNMEIDKNDDENEEEKKPSINKPRPDLQLAEIVYRQALKELSASDDLQTNLRFWFIADQYDICDNFAESILNELEINYGGHANVWEAKIRRSLRKFDQRHTKQNDVIIEIDSAAIVRDSIMLAVDMYEEAVLEVTVDPNQIWRYYYDYCVKMLSKKGRIDVIRELILGRLKSVLERAVDNGHATETDLVEWLDELDVDDSNYKSIILDKASDSMPRSAKLHCLRLKQLIHSDRASKKDIQSAFNVALSKICAEDALPLFELVKEWLSNEGDNDRVEKLLTMGLKKYPLSIHVELKKMFLNWAVKVKEFEEIDKIFDDLTRCTPYDVDLFMTYIKLACSKDSFDRERVRSVFELALNQLGGHCPELWLDYIKFDEKHGCAQVSNIYSRANSSLSPDSLDLFIKQYSIYRAKSGTE